MAEGDPIGLQITVQDFDGFLNKRRARAASYESAAREQALHDVENTVALSVWKSQQALESRPRALASVVFLSRVRASLMTLIRAVTRPGWALS